MALEEPAFPTPDVEACYLTTFYNFSLSDMLYVVVSMFAVIYNTSCNLLLLLSSVERHLTKFDWRISFFVQTSSSEIKSSPKPEEILVCIPYSNTTQSLPPPAITSMTDKKQVLQQLLLQSVFQ